MKNNIYKIGLCLLILLSVACIGDSQNVGDEGGTPASITTIGNPGNDIEANSQVYLTLNQNFNNIRQINNDKLEDVFSLATAPAVQSFDLSPNGALFMYLSENILLDYQECSLIYSYADESQCVGSLGFVVQNKIRFDQKGFLYYSGYSEGNTALSLIRWDTATQEETGLISENVELSQWILHSNGTVYMTGTDNGTSVFQSIDNEDVATALLPEGSLVTDLNFIDPDNLIIHAQSIDYNNAVVSGNFIFNLTTNQITETVDYSGGNLTNIVIDSAKNVYATGDVDAGEEDNIYKIHPGSSQKIEGLGLDKISFFDLYNDVLYVVGSKEGSPKLVSVDLTSDTYETKTLIEGYHIYNLAFDGTDLFFDALKVDSNELSVFKHELESNSVISIEGLSDALIDLQSIYSLKNYSNELKRRIPYAIN